MYDVTKKRGRIKINLKAIDMGTDLCVVITGGEQPHLGAVALSVKRPSLDDPQKISASTSVLTLVGHKEDSVAKKASHTLASQLNKNVVVTCGIHVDDIQANEFDDVLDLLDELLNEFINEYISHPLTYSL